MSYSQKEIHENLVWDTQSKSQMPPGGPLNTRAPCVSYSKQVTDATWWTIKMESFILKGKLQVTNATWWNIVMCINDCLCLVNTENTRWQYCIHSRSIRNVLLILSEVIYSSLTKFCKKCIRLGGYNVLKPVTRFWNYTEHHRDIMPL